MFNLFKKKEESVHVIDKIWMTETAKYNALLDFWKNDPNTVIIAWFVATRHHLETLFAKETTTATPVLLTREIHSAQLAGKRIIFAEHYPLRKKEQELFKLWQLKEAVVCSSLDEAFFKQFGSENIVRIMKLSGMKEDEMIEHKMISSSIVKAQEKIEDKVISEHTASSQQEWIERNLTA